MSTEEERARRRAREKKRYAEDPVFRQKKRASGRAYWAANRARIIERRRRRRTTDSKFRAQERVWARKGRLKLRYGISLDQYQAMLARQGGVCAICKRIRRGIWLCVDHDHGTQAVRELLCRKCNLAIAWFNDDPDLLRAAIAYLEKHRGHR